VPIVERLITLNHCIVYRIGSIFTICVFFLNSLVAGNLSPDSLIVTCPTDVLEYTDAFTCSKHVIYPMPIVENSCGPYDMILEEGPVSGSEFFPGTTIIKYDITDSVGNNLNCTYNVFVLDSISPIIEMIEPVEIFLSESCETMVPNVLPNLSITDNCGIFLIEQDIAEGTTISENTMVNVLVEDFFANDRVMQVEVQVIDTLVPEITCVSKHTLVADSNCEFNDETFEIESIANDNCIQNLNTGSYFDFPYSVGNHSLTSFVVDEQGNEANCETQLIVIDDTSPTIICPEDQILQPSAGCLAVLPNYAEEITVSDNCSSTLNITQTPAPGSFIETSTIITFDVIDASGNSSQCAFFASPDIIDNSVSQEMNLISANLEGAIYQWFDCSGAKPEAITGEVAQIFEATTSGSYAVQITVGTCSVMSECVDIFISNIEDITNELNINVFPNPSNGLFTIDFTRQNQFPIIIEIKDLLGRVVETKVIKSATTNNLDLSNLENGHYSLRAINSKNSFQTTLIKQ